MAGHVLVAYASKMGSTAEIAAGIGAGIREHGHQVDVRDVRHVQSVAEYDAVVLGSAVYNRAWRPEAVHFLSKHADELRAREVWLFQSGPIGPHADALQAMPRKVRQLAERIGAEPAMTFAGRLDPETAQGFLARRMAATVLAGDVRDWDVIGAWAQDVATAISAAEAGFWNRPGQSQEVSR